MAVHCPICGGTHLHSEGGGHRVRHCPASLVPPGAPDGYRIVGTEEPPPEWIADVLRRPLGDLGVALGVVAGDGHLSAADLGFIFNTLVASGFCEEVEAIRAEAGLGDRRARRGALAEAIRRAGSGKMRARLAEACRRAWRGECA